MGDDAGTRVHRVYKPCYMRILKFGERQIWRVWSRSVTYSDSHSKLIILGSQWEREWKQGDH